MYRLYLDFGSGWVDYTPYLVGQYPIKRTRELHNDELLPVTGTCRFSLNRTPELVSSLLIATTDPKCRITKDGHPFFTGTIRRNIDVSVGLLRLDSLELEAVEPYYRLNKKKITTSFTWSDYKVSDPTHKDASILHQLFYLAGFADDELDFSPIDVTIDRYSVDGTDSAVEIQDLVEKLLRDTVYTIVTDARGVLSLFDLYPNTFTPQKELKTGAGGNIAEGYKITRDEFREEAVDVTFWPHKLLENEVVFEDTTGATSSLPCSISIPAGNYYPEGADADTPVKCNFSVEDHDLIAVDNPTLEWAHTGNVTLEICEQDSNGMLLRFYSATGGVITKLRIRGDATVKGDKHKVSVKIVPGTAERESIESELLTEQGDAERCANGRASWHKHAVYLYEFSYLTGIELSLGEIVIYHDPQILGATQTLRIRKIVDGENLKSFHALAEAVGDYAQVPIVHISSRISNTPRDELVYEALAAVSQSVAKTPSFFHDETVPPGPYKAGDFWVHDHAIFISTADRAAGEGTELDWEWYIRPNITTVIESSNGDVFKPGQSMTTILRPRCFRNGLEITDTLPDSAFRWTRTSYYPQTPPNDDATWNQNHAAGYRTIEVTAESIYARATYTVDIIE
jgi:hypothetical protein